MKRRDPETSRFMISAPAQSTTQRGATSEQATLTGLGDRAITGVTPRSGDGRFLYRSGVDRAAEHSRRIDSDTARGVVPTVRWVPDCRSGELKIRIIHRLSGHAAETRAGSASLLC